MGLLSQGQPLEWDELKKYSKLVQDIGIRQFIKLYNSSKNRADGPFKWGDEIEYLIIKIDHHAKAAKLSLSAEQVFQRLSDQSKANNEQPNSIWHPEYAAYMLESTPRIPYESDGHLLAGLCEMETNMSSRRLEALRAIESDESVMSLTCFPRIGCAKSLHPDVAPNPESSVTKSLFLPDEIIFAGHPRFLSVARSIMCRRQRKVAINLPIFFDTNTPDPFIERFKDEEAMRAAKPNHVYLDATGFGMGCCCLQLTLQASHLKEAKTLYDHLVPLAPILIALSAGSPVYRGYLTDIDCRWDVIADACDDRTDEERNIIKNGSDNSKVRIAKSRYSSVSSYLSRQGQPYNDIPLIQNKSYYNLMVSEGVEPPIARHIAHLFIRTPIAAYKEKLDQTDDDTDHFENIQSVNWQTLRFKPPPSANSPIGWRIEFRPIEVQTTDFENAAYVVFVVLLSRIILAYKLNFLLPISLVDENMKRAQKRDALVNDKFWFRRSITHKNSCKPLCTARENRTTTNPDIDEITNNHRAMSDGVNRCRQNAMSPNKTMVEDVNEYAAQMTTNEIINGSENFIGLIPIVDHYVESFADGTNTEIISKIKSYLKLISDRASSKTKTTARFIRDFVRSHPSYARDSVVNEQINYDLICLLDKIGKGEVVCPELSGKP